MRASVLGRVAARARLLDIVFLHLLSSLDQVKCFIECFIVLNYASFFVYYMLLFVRFLVTFLFVGDHVRTYDFNFHLRFLLRVISNL